MARATIYTVHVRGRGRADDDVVLVKDGFSWPAFFFSLIWALWHRLWFFALIMRGRRASPSDCASELLESGPRSPMPPSASLGAC